MIAHREENNSGKAFLTASGIFLALLLICFFARITNPYTPQEEEGEGGIVVNYGTSDEGMGSDYTNVEEPSVDPNANEKPPEERVEDVAPAKPTISDVKEDAIITSNDADAPEVKTPPNKVEKKETKKPPVTAPVKPVEKVKEEAPKVNPNALYKGPKKQTGTGGGDGTGTTPGNQGKVTGDPNAMNYDGTGSGNGGVALNLAGRKFLNRPVIDDQGQEVGRIAVEIVVDRAGNISSAKAGARGTTISNSALWKKCEQAVLRTKLNPITSGPETQVGMVVISFKSN